MQLNRRTLFVAAAVGIAVCLFATFISEEKAEVQQQPTEQQKRKDGLNLLRDHRNLSSLLNAMRLQSGFMTGELRSEEVVNDILSIGQFANLDLNQLSVDLWRISDDIDTIDMGSGRPINLSTISTGINDIVDMKEAERVLKNENRMPILPEDVFATIKRKHDWEKLGAITQANWLFLSRLRQPDSTELLKQYYEDSLDWNEAIEVFRDVHSEVGKFIAKVNATLKKVDSVLDQVTKLMSNTSCSECQSELLQAKVKFNIVRQFHVTLSSQYGANGRVGWLDRILQAFESAEKTMKIKTLERIVDEESDEFMPRVFKGPFKFMKLVNATKPIETYVNDLDVIEKLSVPSESILNSLRRTRTMFEQSREIKKDYYWISVVVDQHKCFQNHTIRPFNLTMVTENFHNWRTDIDATMRKYGGDLDFSVSGDYQKFRDEAIRIIDQPGDRRTRLERLERLVKKDNYKKIEASMKAINEIAYLFKTYIPEHRAQNYKPLAQFQRWIETTSFVNPTCDTELLYLNPIIDFNEFFQFLVALQEDNPIPALVEEMLPPIMNAQDQSRKLHKIARRMKERYKMFPVESRELAEVLKYEGRRIQDVRRGVRSLETMFEWVEHWKWIDNLARNADEVIAEANTITVRSAMKFHIMDAFEELKKDENKIRSFFLQIEQLQKMHAEGQWNNLTDVSKIYEAAESIEKEFGWEKFDHFERFLDRFPDEYFDRSSTMREARKDAIQLAKLDINIWPARKAFQEASAALKTLDDRFDTFTERMKPRSSPFVPKPVVTKNYGFVAMVWIGGFVILAAVISYYLSHTMIVKRKRKVKKVEEKEFVPSSETKQYVAQMLQECRLEINKRDKQRLTRLFRAVLAGRLDLVVALARRGAALDAVCGPKARTALHEAAAIGDAYIVRALLEHGASQHIRDIDGKKPMGLCTKEGKKNHVPGILAGFYSKKIDRIIPEAKRDFYVLIVERPKFAKELIPHLPERLDVVYGYRVGEVDLHEFTHFIIDPEEDGGSDLPLDLDKLFFYECLANPGMIVTTKWLNACLDNPSAVDEDYKYALTDLSFEGLVHKGKLTEIKNDIHRLKPPLLSGVTITIPPTENRVMEEDFEHWVRVIKAFGGEYVDEPCPSTEKEVVYHQKRSKEAPTLHPSIVLIFPDTILDERWVNPRNNISLIGAGWLPESIARYELIRPDHGILKYEPDWEDLQVLFERGPRYERRP